MCKQNPDVCGSPLIQFHNDDSNQTLEIQMLPTMNTCIYTVQTDPNKILVLQSRKDNQVSGKILVSGKDYAIDIIGPCQNKMNFCTDSSLDGLRTWYLKSEEIVLVLYNDHPDSKAIQIKMSYVTDDTTDNSFLMWSMIWITCTFTVFVVSD